MEWSICRESIPTLNTHTHLYHTLTFLGVVVFSQYYFGMTRTKCVLFPMDGVPSNKKVAWHTYLQATIGHGRDLSSTTKLCLSDVSFLLFYCFLSRLFLAISLIISFIQQVIKIDGIRHFNLDKPSLIFCRFIDNTRIVYRLGVDFHHSTRNGRVHIRSGLDRFDTSKRVTNFKFISNFWQTNKDNVTKFSLGKVCNAAGTNVSIDLDVFVS
jgi:hypothetical protein